MSQLYDIILSIFAVFVQNLKAIPVTDNLSLFDFCIAMIVMSTVIFGLIPIVSKVGIDNAADTVKRERAEAEYEKRRADSIADYRTKQLSKVHTTRYAKRGGDK